ncbi:hypothetical protein T02_4096 [Trichinella nativa]|uniref:Uncharacterized protein n=1 Tax=Trichinella nativa TaxID=6335 RepID=A0A0V1LMI2_9BILA|nr:hypothetical protein T02_4096 [Trichinella nativa]
MFDLDRSLVTDCHRHVYYSFFLKLQSLRRTIKQIFQCIALLKPFGVHIDSNFDANRQADCNNNNNNHDDVCEQT